MFYVVYHMNDGVNRMMDNVQNINNCINMPMLPTSRSYLYIYTFCNVLSMNDLMEEYYQLPVFRALTWPLLKSLSHFHPLHCNLFSLFFSTTFFHSPTPTMPLESGHCSVLHLLSFTLPLKRFLKGRCFLTLS
jgi:hypothetical protein